MKDRFFDVYLNDEKVATVGPSGLTHLSVSVSGHQGELMLMANGLSSEEPGQRYFTWLQDAITENDVVRFVVSAEDSATPPRTVRNLRRGQKATKESVFCDFCKCTESEVGHVVQAGESPFICVRCAELCIEIARGRDAEAQPSVQADGPASGGSAA